MSISKREFENASKKWLEQFLLRTVGEKYVVRVLAPESNISKLAVDAIKKIDGYSFMEFKPDVLGILESKENTELVFLNMSVSSLSLKEIGELQCYSRLSKPIFSILTSPKGLASEVALLLLNKETEKSLLSYDYDRFIITFKLDPNTVTVEKTSIYPLEMRHLFT